MASSRPAPPMIAALTIHDAEEYTAHLARNIATSGVGETPIFSARSTQTKVDPKQLLTRVRDTWTRSLDQQGWERAWGLIETDKYGRRVIMGVASLTTSRGLETQLHRATVGLGLEISHRAKGHGKGLMQALLYWAAAQPHLTWIDLGVFAHNQPARRLYESLGFVETGRTPDAFRIDGYSIDDIQMTLRLNDIR